MAEKKKSSAMVPLILVGAALFAFGAYQTLKPKAPEVNTGFIAPADNPRTMQAPDSPPMGQDAAQRAAADSGTTTSKVAANTASVISIFDAPWFKSLQTNTPDFRGQTLAVFVTQEGNRTLTCKPVLSQKTTAELSAIEKVTCTATDGTTLAAEFFDVSADSNNGVIVATSADNKVVMIGKRDDAITVRIRESR